MRVCDRCKKPDPRYYNIYILGHACDLCDKCNKEYLELTDLYDSIEREFLKNKTLKHIDFQWED